MDALLANSSAGIRIRSDAELQESLDVALQGHDPNTDVHVFGYGSLMWNPTLEFSRATKGRVHGWHRRFCLRSLIGRGTPSAPGAILALDRGGACDGLLFRISAGKVKDELPLLWKREMSTRVYEARWIPVLADACRVRALSFVANRLHESYIGDLPVEQIAHMICTARGSLGTCLDYFEATMQALGNLGVKDAGMQRIRDAMKASKLIAN